jgi:hypothetical protein
MTIIDFQSALVAKLSRTERSLSTKHTKFSTAVDLLMLSRSKVFRTHATGDVHTKFRFKFSTSRWESECYYDKG